MAFLFLLTDPVNNIRFRYLNELNGATHGDLSFRGANGIRAPPTVRLIDFTGEAMIVSDLYQEARNGNVIRELHPHRLLQKNINGRGFQIGPIVSIVNQQNGYTIDLPRLIVNRSLVKDVKKQIIEKKIQKLKWELGCETLSPAQVEEITSQTNADNTEINLNRVVLGFTAYGQFRNGNNEYWRQIVDPIFSPTIFNYAPLKIVHISHTTGSVEGNQELTMFVGRIGRGDIHVVFKEVNGSWSETVSEFVLIHQNVGFVLMTPRYAHLNVTQSVEIEISLFRPSDEATSDPMKYAYLPAF